MSHGKRKFLTSLDFKFRCQISFIQMTSKQTSTQYREHMGLIMSFSQKGTEVKISVKNGNAFSMRNETKSSVLYYPLLFHPEKEKIPAYKFGNKSLFVCSCQQCLCKAGRIYCCVFTHWRKNVIKKNEV